ncbi:hypothetical protein I79_015743 [Cricetulus griseus]|uniref:Uncharacterized protein n=1 Tax=Cricetulus griseus TaxID=10029 RepID=G3HXL7_CRIGR|nr:hypothetical protein I79_015743 [Cricetulus griseus]
MIVRSSGYSGNQINNLKRLSLAEIIYLGQPQPRAQAQEQPQLNLTLSHHFGARLGQQP